MFNNITKGLRAFTQGCGLVEATTAAGSILLEGSGPAAAALTASGTPVVAGSAVAIATMTLYAISVFTVIAACAIGPALLFDYLTSNKADDATYDADIASNDVSCATTTDADLSFTQPSLSALEVEIAGLEATPAAA